MSYVAAKGGEEAILAANEALEFLRVRKSDQLPLSLEMIQTQLHALTSRVLSEGGLYSQDLAALAIKQAGGDTLEAAYYLRAHRSACPRLGETSVHHGAEMRVIRRISAAFKDIPGGQILGPTPDYLQRLFRFDLLKEDQEAFREVSRRWFSRETAESDIPDTFPKVLDSLRAEGLLPPAEKIATNVPFDITREPLVFPLPRSASLSILARGETGSVLALGYSNMRGYGDVHPTVAELRVGYLPIMSAHPVTGEPMEAGEILMTECEVVAMFEAEEDNRPPVFTLGYGACFGRNEAKAICMAILDRSMEIGRKHGPTNPSEDEEFVLLHVDGVESMGFATHYKMPHYITFESDLDRIRQARSAAREGNSV
jgi:alpha-D-ribose 1-methylphosphonate 5-triphosphate synthase subunit PhnI